MKTNKRFQFNTPHRPELDALLEASAQRVLRMSPEEREKMIQEQIHNIAPYPDETTSRRDAVPMPFQQDDLKKRLDAWTDSIKQAKAAFAEKQNRVKALAEEQRKLRDFFDAVKVRAVTPPKIDWDLEELRNFGSGSTSPFRDEEIKQQIESEAKKEQDRQFWDDMIQSFNKFDPAIMLGIETKKVYHGETRSPDAGTTPNTCGTPPTGFIDNEWFRNLPKDCAGIVHPRERIVPRYDEPVVPLSEINKVPLKEERKIEIIVKVAREYTPITFIVNSPSVAREQADAIATNGFCHCAGGDPIYYPLHRIEWVRVVGLDKDSAWYPTSGAIIP